MESIQDNNYVVYVRVDNCHGGRRESVESPVQSCSSYSEARDLQRQIRRTNQECVIRFEGISGGGD